MFSIRIIALSSLSTIQQFAIGLAAYCTVRLLCQFLRAKGYAKSCVSSKALKLQWLFTALFKNLSPF